MGETTLDIWVMSANDLWLLFWLQRRFLFVQLHNIIGEVRTFNKQSPIDVFLHLDCGFEFNIAVTSCPSQSTFHRDKKTNSIFWQSAALDCWNKVEITGTKKKKINMT